MNQEELNDALWRACINGNLEEAKELIAMSADVDYADEDGYTPLHWAVWDGYTEIVKLLLEKGANPKAENACGYTPLHWAARFGHTEIVKILKEAMKEAA